VTLNPADLAAACLQAAADDPAAQSRYLAFQTLFSVWKDSTSGCQRAYDHVLGDWPPQQLN
jgi:hypothetical protein